MATPRNPKPSPNGRSLTDRVQEQVDTAKARLVTNKRRRRNVEPARFDAVERSPEVRALHRVFHEMGRSQRAARRQAGLRPFPVVREAAQAFRRAPSFTSLVGVAASLDEVGLLSW
jgi:hypothetical protein